MDEAYRILRSTVKFASGSADIRSLLVVDVDRAESSGVAEHLATSFANAGDHCVLVDVRSIATASDREIGFSDLLGGQGIRGCAGAGSTAAGIVNIGPGVRLTPDMLASDQFLTALKALAATGAFVIIACNSSPEHADALAIAPRVDATILVISGGRTRRARALATRDALERVGARLLGVVMVEEPKRWFW